MPGMQGSELLAMVREEFPSIVRILVTAYSDLESAIEAVNKGHIYQYVSKPWGDDILGILRRAADYHRALSERNELLALKMTTLQRLICGDRLKWLLLLEPAPAGCEEAFRGALSALVSALPEMFESVRSSSRRGYNRADFEIATLVRDEYEIARHAISVLQSPIPAEIPAGLPPSLRESLSALPSSAAAALALSLRNFRSAPAFPPRKWPFRPAPLRASRCRPSRPSRSCEPASGCSSKNKSRPSPWRSFGDSSFFIRPASGRWKSTHRNSSSPLPRGLPSRRKSSTPSTKNFRIGTSFVCNRSPNVKA